jgi:large subunit ribosomal protein L6
MERSVEVPSNVKVEVEKFKFKVEGPMGKLEKDFYSTLFAKDITIQKSDNKITIATNSKKKKVRAMMGTIESVLSNMIDGVREAYTAKLKLIYMHFPFTVKVSGKEVLISNFLGAKAPRKAKIIGDCKVEIQGDEITVTGIDKQDVGQTAAQLEHATWIKQRDRRVFQDGLFVTKKP